jgi:hypothetical protein
MTKIAPAHRTRLSRLAAGVWAGLWLAVAPTLLADPQIAPSPALPYVCPMHAEVRTNGPGACPRCGMALVMFDPLDMRDYPLDVETAPHPLAAGQPSRLHLTVRDPATNNVVRDFAVVHERLYHLFVISQDLEYYDHLHPVQQEDGSFVLDLTLPRAGYYKVYSDFLPGGGTPQVIARLLVTRGFTGDLASSAARLVPDRLSEKTVAGMSVALELPAEGLIAGRDETFTYRLMDSRTGAPITDIEPYLGAWGHSVIMSEDTLNFVHAHPIELVPQASVAAGGGPTLTFKAVLPRPGNYRAWTQIKRRGDVSTAVFTVTVTSPATH